MRVKIRIEFEMDFPEDAKSEEEVAAQIHAIFTGKASPPDYSFCILDCDKIPPSSSN